MPQMPLCWDVGSGFLTEREARAIPRSGTDTTGGVDMVRHWFSLTIVMALAVLMVAVEDSQGRERRLGRRRRDNTLTYVSSGPALSGPYYMDPSGRLVDSMGRPVTGYVDEGLFADNQTEGRGANYPPDMAGSQRGARSVLLQVRVPANAEVLIDG